jgi:hypothetical protein
LNLYYGRVKKMEENQRQRSGCLSAFLIVFLVLGILGVIMDIGLLCIGVDSANKLVPGAKYTTTTIAISTIVGIIEIAGLALMLKWKKIGVFLYVGIYILNVLYALITATSAATIVMSLISAAIVLVIFFVLIKNAFAHFE